MSSIKSNYATRFLLLISGLLAAGIAVNILFAPGVFYAGYGIDFSSDDIGVAICTVPTVRQRVRVK